jgi:hypothetical protein
LGHTFKPLFLSGWLLRSWQASLMTMNPTQIITDTLMSNDFSSSCILCALAAGFAHQRLISTAWRWIQAA